jgi:hypothetical protein
MSYLVARGLEGVEELDLSYHRRAKPSAQALADLFFRG